MTETRHTQNLEDGPLAARGTTKITLGWTSIADGSAAGTTERVTGEIVRVVFIPGTGGDKPSDNYDLTLLDENGVDVLSGLGANIDADAVSEKSPGMTCSDGTNVRAVHRTVSDALTLALTNAGNTKSGQIVLYVRE
jgi:hypothetical protein